MKQKQRTLTPRQGLALLLILAAMLTMLVLPANAAGAPAVSSDAYYACYTLSSSGKLYAYADSGLSAKTGGYIDCAADECRIVGVSGDAVCVSYPVSRGRRTAWFPRSSFTESDLTSSGLTAVTAAGKITTYKRASGSSAYGYIAKGDSVTVLGSSGSRTQVIYNVGPHYKMAWAESGQVSQYLTGGGSSGSSIADGSYTLTTALKSDMVLDVNGNSSENGTNIQIYTSNGTPAQIFQISAVGGGWYKIVHADSGKVVDVSGGEAASGTNVWLYEYNGTDAQLWRLIPYSNGYLIQNKLGCYLDVSGGDTSDCTNVWAYECNYTASQIWFLHGTSSPAPAANTLTNGLYNINSSSSLITCGFDGYKNTKGRHEGIDLTRGLNSPVYALADGVITRVTHGSTGSGGLSTIAIYNSATDKTVVYLHTQPLPDLSAGQSIQRGQQIAVESWRGISSASSAHTHVEVRNGRRTSAAKSVGDYTLDNENPASFWNSLGYRVY